MGIGILILSFALWLTLGHACPPEENIAPLCTCRRAYDGNMMICKGLLNPDQLLSPINEVATNNMKLFSLSINNSSLLYIPDGIFKNVGLEKIRFVSTELMSLSDSDVAFSGLEDSLVEIRATAAHYTAQWDWQQLKNLKKMELIDVNWISMGSISDTFPELPKLTHLGIIRAEISFIVDNAFATLNNLMILNMKENDISELKRNMLPDPADSLFIMDFSDNDLVQLPEDFFANMPNLESVHLDKNKFVTLQENPFSAALQTLQALTMFDNPLRCDCRMRWLAGVRTPSNFVATCSSPGSLKGVSVRSLNLKSLLC